MSLPPFRVLLLQIRTCVGLHASRFHADALPSAQQLRQFTTITETSNYHCRDANHSSRLTYLPLHASFCSSSSTVKDDATHNDKHTTTETPSPELDAVKLALLNGALKHVQQYGWSVEALTQSAREQGLSPSVVGMLPRGEAELVEHFIDSCNQQLAQKLEDEKDNLSGKSTTEKVHTAVKYRLEMIAPYISTWPQALSIAAKPSNAGRSLHLLYNLVNTIWYAAGDKSTDTNWYTKRLLLAGVYTSTELYMLTDFSPAYVDTWEALDRRLNDVISVGKQTRELGQIASSVTEQFGSMLLSLMRSVDQSKHKPAHTQGGPGNESQADKPPGAGA